MPDHLPLTLAVLPGLPRPETSGARYEAELAYIEQHGLPRPILVDRAGVVWAGRTTLNICCELGLIPVTQEVTDGQAAAIQELATRDLTVLEWADLVLAVHDGPSTNSVLGPGRKRAAAVSVWFTRMLGKTRGFSPSQVEQYLRVARSSPDDRRAMASARSLGRAIRLLKERTATTHAAVGHTGQLPALTNVRIASTSDTPECADDDGSRQQTATAPSPRVAWASGRGSDQDAPAGGGTLHQTPLDRMNDGPPAHGPADQPSADEKTALALATDLLSQVEAIAHWTPSGREILLAACTTIRDFLDIAPRQEPEPLPLSV